MTKFQFLKNNINFLTYIKYKSVLQTFFVCIERTEKSIYHEFTNYNKLKINIL